MKPVGFGFLGAGGMARAMASFLGGVDEVQLVAAAARDPERAQALSPVRVHRSYEDLVQDDEVEVVYVALQNDVHLDWALAALAAGKHVLCEKPLAMTAAEVDAMAAAAGDLHVVEASWYRWHPRTRDLEALIAAGRLGDVQQVTCRFTIEHDFPGNYRRLPEHGGGALYDIGHYALSAALACFPGQQVQAVRATTRCWDTGVDATADVVLELEGGRADVHVSFEEPVEQSWRVDGTRTSVDVGLRPFNPPASEPVPLVVDDERREHPATNAYAVMAADVARAVRGEPSSLLPLAESRRTAAVIDAAFASAAAGGRPVAPQAPALPG